MIVPRPRNGPTMESMNPVVRAMAKSPVPVSSESRRSHVSVAPRPARSPMATTRSATRSGSCRIPQGLVGQFLDSALELLWRKRRATRHADLLPHDVGVSAQIVEVSAGFDRDSGQLHVQVVGRRGKDDIVSRHQLAHHVGISELRLLRLEWRIAGEEVACQGRIEVDERQPLDIRLPPKIEGAGGALDSGAEYEESHLAVCASVDRCGDIHNSKGKSAHASVRSLPGPAIAAVVEWRGRRVSGVDRT